MFPADHGYHCCLPQGAAPTSPVSCPFPSVGCSTQRVGRWSSWDLHTGMWGLPLPAEQCPRKETQHTGAIGEERRRPVIWARVASDALSNRPPFLDRAGAHNGLMHPARAAMAGSYYTFVSHLTEFLPVRRSPPSLFFSWFPTCRSTGVIQAFSWCNTAGEFHPQWIWLGKLFSNRKQTPLQPTRWSVKAYVLDLQ